MNKLVKTFFSMTAAIIMLLLLIVLFAVATFVENDFGTMIAKHYFYLALWTKIIFVLLIFNFVGVFIKKKLFRLQKIHVSFFHSGFIVILIGAFVTHIFGYEGTMMIANRQSVNTMITQHHELVVTRTTKLDTVLYKTIWNLHQPKTKPAITFGNTALYFNAVKENIGLQFVFKQPQNMQNLLLSAVQDSTAMSNNRFCGTLMVGDTTYTFSYAPQRIVLPFTIRLDSFKMQRYPGSQSPSSFSSYAYITTKSSSFPFHIYMNNILSVEGYRIYQSSYFKNEQGTILTVNNDFWGTTITYIGYILLLLGFLMTLFNRYSYLRKTVIRKSILVVILFLLTFITNAKTTDSIPTFKPEHVEKYGQLYIQNFKGRMQTIHTFGLEVLRKIARKDNIDHFSPDEFILSITLFPAKWWTVPVIKVNNQQLQKILQTDNNYAALDHFFGINQEYLISDYVNEAQNKKPATRTSFDKEVLKVNERVNILYQIMMGYAFKILPSPYKNTTHWLSPTECQMINDTTPDVNFVKHIYPYYLSMAQQAVENQTGYENADYLLNGIAIYQEKMSAVELPTKTYNHIELWYQKIDVFWRLFPFFASCGLAMLFVIIYGIIRHRATTYIYQWLQRLVIVGFVLQTVGLAVRWYLSGHPPMSNAFETLIYVSWCIILIGIFFTRKSPLLAAIATFCGALPLLVAHLNAMDPEITPLVPVLQSTWLLIHVSVITSSYGFFAIMALIAIIFFILTLFIQPNNKQEIEEAIYKITVMSNKVAILGLGLLTIGTFMGAVWANQSWGRYWGWDPKETWSLITMLCYAIVIHSRFIKPLNSIFGYHIISLFAFASVLMTYFGVNFYLSGLHSYASGDPLTLPFYIYIILAAIVLIIILSYYHLKRKYKK